MPSSAMCTDLWNLIFATNTAVLNSNSFPHILLHKWKIPLDLGNFQFIPENYCQTL